MADSFGTNDLNSVGGISREEFIKKVNDELTMYGSIPFKLPYVAIEGLIKDSLDFFYRKYPDALQEYYLLVFRDYINSIEFKTNRRIQLPRSIYSVNNVIKNNDRYNYDNSDFSIYRAIGYSSYSGRGAGYSMVDNTIQWLGQMSLFSLFNDVVLSNVVSYEYNRLSRTIFISGEIPTEDLIIIAQERLPEEFLFEDDYFRKYVRALAKIRLAKIMGFFNIPLPGNVQIDFDGLANEGNDELTEVKEEINTEENIADYFFMSDSN